MKITSEYFLDSVLRARNQDKLYYWTEFPGQRDDPEWYAPHWHPCTDLPFLDGSDMKRLAEELSSGRIGVCRD